MIKTLPAYLYLMLILVGFCSCTKETRDLRYAQQEEKISAYVEQYQKDHEEAEIIYNEGSVRIIFSEGSGPELTARGKATVNYAGYDFSSGNISTSTMFVTNSMDVASSSSWSLSDTSLFVPMEIDLTDKTVIKGLRNGLSGVTEGEECMILFSGRYGFGKEKIGTIPADAALAYHIWVQSIEN